MDSFVLVSSSGSSRWGQGSRGAAPPHPCPNPRAHRHLSGGPIEDGTGHLDKDVGSGPRSNSVGVVTDFGAAERAVSCVDAVACDRHEAFLGYIAIGAEAAVLRVGDTCVVDELVRVALHPTVCSPCVPATRGRRWASLSVE